MNPNPVLLKIQAALEKAKQDNDKEAFPLLTVIKTQVLQAFEALPKDALQKDKTEAALKVIVENVDGIDAVCVVTKDENALAAMKRDLARLCDLL